MEFTEKIFHNLKTLFNILEKEFDIYYSLKQSTLLSDKNNPLLIIAEKPVVILDYIINNEVKK